MSTPSTLPPHHPSYGYPHHQTYQANTGYRASNTLLNGGSRLGASYFPNSSSTSTTSNSIGAPDPPPPRQNAVYTPPTRYDSTAATMPASQSESASKQNPKKRQRSREPAKPDWRTFYKNGLPAEVIIIDDTPTPEPSASVVSNPQTVAAESTQHAAKKRRRDDVGTAYDPVYHHGHSVSNNQTPDYKDSAAGSTISTDRTTSAIHTTAATSLGSHSSNGQNGYEAVEAQPGQKRKRTATRLQIANEAKRKELEEKGDAYTNYRPPPRPPIKAPDVQVKVVADVRPEVLSSNVFALIMKQNSYTKNSKIDDDDGHYIVVPDTHLTERCESQASGLHRTMLMCLLQTKSQNFSVKGPLGKSCRPEIRGRINMWPSRSFDLFRSIGTPRELNSGFSQL